MSEAAAEARHERMVAAAGTTTPTAPTGIETIEKRRGQLGGPPVPQKPGGGAVTPEATDVSGLFGLVKGFTATAQQDPRKLQEAIFDTILGLATAASILSVIPFENNFGGPLAARILDRLVQPWLRAAYTSSIEVALRPVYPTDDVAPRLLVSGIEAGSISDDDLHAELVRSGVQPEAQTIIAKVAIQKRFEAETKDDIALLRTYQSDINRAVIAELQDELKARLVDLRATRKDLATQYRNLVTKVA